MFSLRYALVLAVSSSFGCATHPRSPEAPCPATSAPVASAAPAASGGVTPPDAARETASPASEAARAPSPRDAAALNAWIAKSEHARDLPLLVAHVFANAEARNVTLAVSYASGEAALGATATVTLDGLLDDSVHGEEHVLTFTRDAVDTPWRLTQATSRVRCRPGRGHAELSAAPCT